MQTHTPPGVYLSCAESRSWSVDVTVEMTIVEINIVTTLSSSQALTVEENLPVGTTFFNVTWDDLNVFDNSE